jgi:hypothetical protein
MPGVPSAGRTSMIAGASTAMSNLYCRMGREKFAEKARRQPVKKARCRTQITGAGWHWRAGTGVSAYLIVVGQMRKGRTLDASGPSS